MLPTYFWCLELFWFIQLPLCPTLWLSILNDNGGMKRKELARKWLQILRSFLFSIMSRICRLRVFTINEANVSNLHGLFTMRNRFLAYKSPSILNFMMSPYVVWLRCPIVNPRAILDMVKGIIQWSIWEMNTGHKQETLHHNTGGTGVTIIVKLFTESLKM